MTQPPEDPLRKQSDEGQPVYPPPGSYPPPQGPYPPPQGSYPPPQGSYPPPPGAYPPPQGSYPPPQYGQPAAGGFPPPPPTGDYGQPNPYGAPGGPSFPPQYSLGNALEFGWNRFKDNALMWILMVLISGVIGFVAYLVGVVGVFAAASSGSDSGSSIGLSVGSLLLALILAVAVFVIQLALSNGALAEASGRKPSIGDFFAIPNVGRSVGTTLLVALIVAIGFFLFVIPGVILAYLLSFSIFYALDKNQSPLEAMKSSVRLTTSQFANVFVLLLVSTIVLAIGGVLCGILSIVTVPLTSIAAAFAYRSLGGAPQPQPGGQNWA